MRIASTRIRRRWSIRAVSWAVPLAVAIGLTGIALSWWWHWAWMAAALTLLLYGLGSAMAMFDRAADGAEVDPGLDGERREEASREIAFRLELGTSVALWVGLLAIATVVAAAFLDFRTIALGAFAIFLLMLLFVIPFWLAEVSEEAAHVHDRTTRE